MWPSGGAEGMEGRKRGVHKVLEVLDILGFESKRLSPTRITGIFNSYLVPKWEVSLRREALIRATHTSTAIEGNPLTLEEVSELAQGRKVTAPRNHQIYISIQYT